MIIALRQRHRRIFFALGIFLPAVLVVGVAARRPVPVTATLPGVLEAAEKFDPSGPPRDGLFPKSAVSVQWLRGQNNSGALAVRFSAAKDFVKPDLMVYWVAGNPKATDALSANAVLLGAFAAAALPLPAAARDSAGVFVLFSLADGEVVDVSTPLQPFNGSKSGALK